jgi:hypothetical protein
MDLNIFAGDVVELSEDNITKLGEHNFNRVNDDVEVFIDMTETPTEETKIMKTKDIKKKAK